MVKNIELWDMTMWHFDLLVTQINMVCGSAVHTKCSVSGVTWHDELASEKFKGRNCVLLCHSDHMFCKARDNQDMLGNAKWNGKRNSHQQNKRAK